MESLLDIINKQTTGICQRKLKETIAEIEALLAKMDKYVDNKEPMPKQLWQKLHRLRELKAAYERICN